jgi:hypothetical protein
MVKVVLKLTASGSNWPNPQSLIYPFDAHGNLQSLKCTLHDYKAVAKWISVFISFRPARFVVRVTFSLSGDIRCARKLKFRCQCGYKTYIYISLTLVHCLCKSTHTRIYVWRSAVSPTYFYIQMTL